MNFWHRLGFHDLHFVEEVYITQPKCGPYDPRSDKERQITKNKFVCCLCGIEKIEDLPDYDIP